MPKKSTPALPRPTDGELAILNVLWERGASTVRQVHDALTTPTTPATPTTPTTTTPAKTTARRRSKSIGYTTILKLMQIMAEKGLAIRDESQRSHIYRPAASEQSTQQSLARDLTHKAFGGSMSKLVMGALSAEKTSPAELRKIRALIDELEGGKK